MNRFRLEAACVVLSALLACPALAYDSSTHQSLTFLAAKQFNRCVDDTPVPPLTALEVRQMARSNVRLAESNLFSRLFRWRYYDRAEQAERSFLWVVDTRFHEHFNEILRRLRNAEDDVDRFRELGRVISYLQVVSSPAHVVPVYTARWWRLSLTDRFDGYPLDEAALEAALADDCGFLEASELEYRQLLTTSATRTLTAVVQPIPGMPVTWEAFWSLGDDDDSFGEYGPAGNSFGRRTEFRCDGQQRCLLLDDDPLYEDFALERHLQAARSTMLAMYHIQRNRPPQVAHTP